MFKSSFRSAGAAGALLLALFTGFAGLVGAGSVDERRPGLSTEERLQKLRPIYEALQRDPTFQALRTEAKTAGQDPEFLERWLQFLPLPPLDLAQIESERRRDLTPISYEVTHQNARWFALHEDAARELYGDARVDAVLAPKPDAPRGAVPSLRTFGGENINVATHFSPPPFEYQGEVHLAVNPNNPNQVVAASNTYGGPIWTPCDGERTVAIFFSHDGGASWGHTCAPKGDAFNLGACSGFGIRKGADPSLAWDNEGKVFLSYLLVCEQSEDVKKSALVVAQSTDLGVTWTAKATVGNGWGAGGQFHDKNMYAIDRNPASPYYNRHYVCWDRDEDEHVAFSPGGAPGFVTSKLPETGFTTFDHSCEIAIADDATGTVHVIFTANASGGSVKMYSTKSVNGGLNWSTPVHVRGFNLALFQKPKAQNHRGIFPFGALAIDNSGGACNGYLYVAYSDWSTGQTVDSTDVWLQRSIDGGASWSPAIKINDDNLANRVQFHPWVETDPATGHVVAAWYDARSYTNNKQVEVFAARSTDCGLSFEPNQKVARAADPDFNNVGDVASNENTTDNTQANPNQYGEYLGLDVAGGKAYVAWVDSRMIYPLYNTDDQKENIAFARMDFGATCGNGVREGIEVCDGTALGGKTCASFGFHGGTLFCSSCRAFSTTSCTGTPFQSIAAEDGSLADWLFGVIADADETGAGVTVGDNFADYQTKGLISFNTSTVPDGATITTATLRLRRATVVGTNPFSTHGALNVSIAHAFHGNVALETWDFAAPATATNVCTLTNASSDAAFSVCTLNAAGRAAINKAGRTQFRLAFASAANGDDEPDYVGFYSGESTSPDNRPHLVLTWQ